MDIKDMILCTEDSGNIRDMGSFKDARDIRVIKNIWDKMCSEKLLLDEYSFVHKHEVLN